MRDRPTQPAAPDFTTGILLESIDTIAPPRPHPPVSALLYEHPVLKDCPLPPAPPSAPAPPATSAPPPPATSTPPLPAAADTTDDTSADISAENPAPFLIRLSIRNGEYAYARPDDIVLIESADHIVRVYIARGDKIRKVVRNNTLKDFLRQLPPHQFLRINRFCAVNSNRLSGGSYHEQSFEFDFRITIKLKHTVPQKLFNAIGK